MKRVAIKLKKMLLVNLMSFTSVLLAIKVYDPWCRAKT
jgi:hypothetical protein